MFDDTKYFHSTCREESLFLQLPRPPFQRLRSRSSCRSAIASGASNLLVSLPEGALQGTLHMKSKVRPDHSKSVPSEKLELLYRGILDNALDGIITMGADGRV